MEGGVVFGAVQNPLDRLNTGKMEHGCDHYRRRCRIRAPCCNEIYDCRHCHNEAMIDVIGSGSIDLVPLVFFDYCCEGLIFEGPGLQHVLIDSNWLLDAQSHLKDPKQRHELPRYKVERVICSLCDTEQNVNQVCENCGVKMGEYFCSKCKFFDDDISKKQYHCDDCGICRVGGRDNFFHCQKCGCCYTVGLQKAHSCVENSMRHNCPVCFEYLFDSLKPIAVLRCGHTMHGDCLSEMQMHSQYSCPMCSKSVCDMSLIWEQLDQEIAATPMPNDYQDKMVWILCNDCDTFSEVQFHIVAQKCLKCKSYNTRQTRGPGQ